MHPTHLFLSLLGFNGCLLLMTCVGDKCIMILCVYTCNDASMTSSISSARLEHCAYDARVTGSKPVSSIPFWACAPHAAAAMLHFAHEQSVGDPRALLTDGGIWYRRMEASLATRMPPTSDYSANSNLGSHDRTIMAMGNGDEK